MKKFMKILTIFFSLILIFFISARYFNHLILNPDPYNYFSEAKTQNTGNPHAIIITDDRPYGRDLTNSERKILAQRYHEIWQKYNEMSMIEKSLSENSLNEGLDAYFLTPALSRAHSAISQIPPRTHSQMILLQADLKPKNLHIDGSLIEVYSDNAHIARYIYNDENIEFFGVFQECWRSTIYSKTIGWKIGEHQRECANALPETYPEADENFPKLKGINYYPSDTAWSLFWTNYDPEIMKNDLNIIKSLGANSMRIFLPVEDFVDSIELSAHQYYLNNLLTQAAEMGIYVIPTLFDFRGALTPTSWGRDVHYLHNVLPILSQHKNIAYVDIKNEIDLDEYYQSPFLIEVWVRTMLIISREIAPNLKYSLGWSNAENALRFQEIFDVISYHEYGDIDEQAKKLEKIQNLSGKKPVIISEIGYSSGNLIAGYPSSAQHQAAALKASLNNLDEANGILVWAYSDFTALDPKAIGGSKIQQFSQKHYGLVHNNKDFKAAALVFQEWSNQ